MYDFVPEGYNSVLNNFTKYKLTHSYKYPNQKFYFLSFLSNKGERSNNF